MAAVAAAPSPTVRFAFLRRHWRLVGFILCGIVPFAPSIWAMQSFLLADNALGFVPFMLPAAAVVFWARSRSNAAPTKRDVLLDCFFAGPAIVIALFALFLVPAKLSWYFWLYRVDLFAMTLVVMASAFIFLGYNQVLRSWQAFMLLFLCWPYPVVRFQELLVGPMTTVTVLAGRAATAAFELPYKVEGGSFTSTHLRPDDNFSITLSSLCSGSALTMGFLLVGLFLICLMRGRLTQRLRWLALGAVLAYLANLIRVAALLVTATNVDYAFAIDTLHPVLGLVLFAIVVLTMLVLLKPFGLELTMGEGGSHRSWEPVEGGGRALLVLFALMGGIAGLTGVFVAEAQQFSFLGTGQGAPVVDVSSERTILPEAAGWTLTHIERIGWSDLYGDSSRGDLFAYAFPKGPTVIAQVVVADQKAALDRYSIEQCIIFHRAKVEAVEYVSLPRGMTGVIVHDTYQGIPSSALYWEHPVRVDGVIKHVRIALLLDIQEPTKRIEQRDLPAAQTLAQRYGIEFTTMMDGNAPKQGDVRGTVDLELIELASKLVDQMVATGGPGAVPVPTP